MVNENVGDKFFIGYSKFYDSLSVAYANMEHGENFVEYSKTACLNAQNIYGAIKESSQTETELDTLRGSLNLLEIKLKMVETK